MLTPCPARIVVNGLTHICDIPLSADGTHGDLCHESRHARWLDTDVRYARLAIDQRLSLEALAIFDAQQSDRGRVDAMQSVLRQAFADTLGMEHHHAVLAKPSELIA